VKKTINLLRIIVVSTIICLTLASCIIFVDPDNDQDEEQPSYLKVVNKYDLPIHQVYIKFIDIYRWDYSFMFNIPRGKSETFLLEPYSAPYSAEVIVFFGDMYSYKELKFTSGATTTATLNVNGILE